MSTTRVVRHIAASPARVYRALLDAREGGRFRISCPSGKLAALVES